MAVTWAIGDRGFGQHNNIDRGKARVDLYTGRIEFPTPLLHYQLLAFLVSLLVACASGWIIHANRVRFSYVQRLHTFLYHKRLDTVCCGITDLTIAELAMLGLYLAGFVG